jgi:hypothetical protein
MIKTVLVCDNCCALIGEGKGANEIRLQAQALYRRRDGKDLCSACAGAKPRRHLRLRHHPWRPKSHSAAVPARSDKKSPGRAGAQ